MTYRPDCVFITGATSGFGLAFAKKFSAAGCKLVLTGRRGEELKKIAAGFKTPVHSVTMDMRDRAAMEQAIADLPPDFKNIDCLINNAGGALGLEPLHKTPLEDLEFMIDTNVRGLVTLTRLLLPGMTGRKRGHIINIGSIAGNYPYPGGHVYGGTKAFVKQFSLSLRADLGGTHVRVTNIEPGMAETNFSVHRFKGDQEKAAAVYKGMQPLTADDIAEAVFWCATQPEHVNINRLEVMPTAQSFNPFAVARDA